MREITKQCPSCRHLMFLFKEIKEVIIEIQKYYYKCSHCGARTGSK